MNERVPGGTCRVRNPETTKSGERGPKSGIAVADGHAPGLCTSHPSSGLTTQCVTTVTGPCYFAKRRARRLACIIH